MRQLILKPHDVVVALKLCGETPATYGAVAKSLFLSVSEVHVAVRRCTHAGLLGRAGDRAPLRTHAPVVGAIKEFVLHGVRYAFPAVRGGVSRGVPTAHAAPPLAAKLADPGQDPPPVWPDPRGTVRGLALCPLYPGAPAAAAEDARLYALLVLIDALRIGRAREREIARGILADLLGARGRTAAPA